MIIKINNFEFPEQKEEFNATIITEWNVIDSNPKRFIKILGVQK